MNARVQQAMPARASSGPGPATLKPSRAIAAADAAPPASAGTARQGHDFARVAVAPATDAAPIQRVEHHNPEKKKYLAKAVGKKQNAIARAALAVKKAAPQGQQISNKEAARRAKAALRG